MIIHKHDFDPKLLNWSSITPDLIKSMGDELLKFHQGFEEAFVRQEQKHLSLGYLKGLLSDLERKNIELIALRYFGPKAVRPLQFFLKDYKYDDGKLFAKYESELSGLISSDEGMITLDSSENSKKGKESVGVAPQYCNNLGKVANCQSGVFLGYTSSKGYGLIDKQLYLPEIWFSEKYKERREKCGIPDNVSFNTKIEIGTEMIERALEKQVFTASWIGADTTFGNDSKFRNRMDSLGLNYLVTVKKNTLVWLKKPEVETYYETEENGNKMEKQKVKETAEKPISVEDIVNNDMLKWETVKLEEGAKGPLFANISRIKVVEHINGLPGKEVWLFIRKDPDGAIKYLFSNALQASLSELSEKCIMRYPIEQSFKDGKDYLGMDHYEHRSWKAWHRHMLYVFMAMLFLLKLRITYKKNFPH